jgi:hypothetical protein
VVAERVQQRQQAVTHVPQALFPAGVHRRPGVDNDTKRPDLTPAPDRMRQRPGRKAPCPRVRRPQVDQVRGVHEDLEAGHVRVLAHRRVLPRVAGRCGPATRIGDEHLDRLGTHRLGVPKPAGGQPSGRRNVGADRPLGQVRWHEPRAYPA